MTVLDVAKLASTVIGVTTPTALFSQTDDTSLQMQNCLNEAAAMIAFDTEHEWSLLKAIATITGDGNATAFDFPDDYQKMLKTARLWPSSMPNSPLTHYTDLNRWLGMQVQAFTPVLGAWIIIGSQINILPVLGAAVTVKYAYLRKQFICTAAGQSPTKTAFTLDTDVYPLGERLLRAAFVYRWKQDRGQDYGEPMEDYQTVLASHIAKDKGSNIIVAGRERLPAGVSFAWPGVLGS